MNHEIETLTHETDDRIPAGYSVRLGYEECPDNPRTWASPFTVATTHSRVIPVDQEYSRWDIPEDADLVAPVFYEPEPSGQGRYYCQTLDELGYIPSDDPELWDAYQIGFAWCEAGTLGREGWTTEQAASYLAGELRIYTQWANGEVYCFACYDDRTGEYLDGCAGFYSTDDATSDGVASVRAIARARSEAAADLQKAAIMAGLGLN